MTKRGVMLELSAEQVREVVRAATAGRGPSVWQIELGLSREALLGAVSRPLPAVVDGRVFSHSLARGLRVLAVFPADGGLRGVAEIAKGLGMKRTTVHRYIVTFVALGLVVQDPVTRQYRRTEG
jgi:IclR helix-turn-helix domain